MHIEGGCYCGQIRYSFDGEPAGALQCHCRECQYITGGNPNVIVILPESGFEFSTGKTSTFTRSDIDNAVTRHFCPNCGTSIWWGGDSDGPLAGRIGVAGGCFADPDFPPPTVALYEKRRHPWVSTPEGITCFTDMPSLEGIENLID